MAVARIANHQGKQRSLRAGRQGLPADLQQRVEHLSGMPMDHVEVQYHSSKPKQVGALAFTQGNRIFVGPGQEKHLPHEAWHVVQQMQGRVRSNTTMPGGLAGNDAPALEAEADRMASLTSRVSPAMTAMDTAALAVAAPVAPSNSVVQRRVEIIGDEATEAGTALPPISSLLAGFNADLFAAFEGGEPAIIEGLERYRNPLKRALHYPIGIHGNIRKVDGESPPARTGNQTRNVGKMGIDEFALRTGGTFEIFEGGHLVPNELWASDQAEVSRSYANLVPMSRTLNVGGVGNTWRNVERELLSKYTALANGGAYEFKIQVGHQDYQLTLGQISDALEVPLKEESEPDTDAVRSFGWIPTEIKAQIHGFDEVVARENVLHQLTGEIDNWNDFYDALVHTPLWGRLSEDLQGEFYEAVDYYTAEPDYEDAGMI